MTLPEAGSIGTLRAGDSNLVLAKTRLSLGFRSNSCRRPVHAGVPYLAALRDEVVPTDVLGAAADLLANLSVAAPLRLRRT